MSSREALSAPAAAIAAALLEQDAEERRISTARLAELDAREALPLLLLALGDVDWRVRKEATIAARAFLPDRVLIDALIRVLDTSADVGIRNAAVDVLAYAGRAAVGPIEDAMSRLDADGRKLAIDALGRSRDAAAIGPLEAALFDPDDNVRQAAVEAIAAIGAVAGEPAQKILMRCLGEDDRFVRLAALEGLNHLGVIVPWDRLEPLLDEPTSRAAALSAAALTEHPRAPMALAKALASSRGGAFSQALTALAHLAEGPLAARVAEAVRAQGSMLAARIVRIAKGEEPDLDHLRASALTLAATANVDGAVEAATQALREQSLAVAAPRALELLGLCAIPALIAMIGAQSFETPDTRSAAVDAAASIAAAAEGSGAAAETTRALLEALRAAAVDADKDVSTSALYALSRLGTEADLELAAARARCLTLAVASAAEHALSSLADRFPGAARDLAHRLMKSEPSSLAAVVLLGALGSAGALDLDDVHAEVAFLASAATSGDARTRRAAVMAVADIGGLWAADVLSFALADEEHDVQLAAARALGRVCVDPAAGRYLETGPPSGIPSSRKPAVPMPVPRTSASDMLDLVGRSGDDDLVAAAVNALGVSMTTWRPPASLPPPSDEAGAAAKVARASSMGGPPGQAGLPPHTPRMMPPDDLIAALAPLASKAPSAVAIAAVDALCRAPLALRGREPALLGGLDHPDPAVMKAAMLKLDRTDAALDKVSRRLDHPSRDVRLLAAEVLTGHARGAAQERLRRRAEVEVDAEVRAAIERACAPAAGVTGGPTGGAPSP